MNDRYAPISEIIALYDKALITKGEARALLVSYFPEIGRLAIAKEADKTD